MKFCIKCGEPLKPNQKFCTKCGHQLEKNTNEQTTILSSQSFDTEKTQAKQDNSDLLNANEESNPPINSEAYERNLYETTNHNNSKEMPPRKKNNSIVLIIIAAIIVTLATLGTIFNKPIANKYYLFKCDSTKDPSLKVDYSYKALSKVSNDATKLVFENSLKEYAQINAESAEAKLNEYKNSISEETYINLSKSIFTSKAESFINKNMAKEAFNELVKLNNLKGDFKGTKSYEKILLALIASKLNVDGYDSLTLLAKEKNIYVRNMDEDVFDEIIQIQEKNIDYYTTDLTINLYKFNDGEYKRLDSVSINYLENVNDLGIYPYEKDKYAVFISGSMAKYNKITYVYSINNATFNHLASISGYNFSRAVDVDNNGIYEIEAHVIDDSVDTSYYSNADMPLVKEVYSVGKVLTLVSSEKINTVTSSFNTNNLTNPSGYIFFDSNSRYLTDLDLYLLSKEVLELARNEIFARHGYMFNMERFKNYFSAKSWYIPNPYYKGEDNVLNEFEKANYKIIQKWEALK